MTKPVLISGIQPTGRLHLGNYLGALKNFVELQNSGKYDCYFFVADYHSLTIDFDPRQKTEETLDVVRAYLAAGINPKKSTIFVQSQVPESTELTWIFNAIAPIGELERMTQFKEKTHYKEYIKIIKDYEKTLNVEELKSATKKFREPFTLEKLHKEILNTDLDNEKSLLLSEAKIKSLMELAIKIATDALAANETLKNVSNEYKKMQHYPAGLLTYPLLMTSDILLYDAKFVPVGNDQLQHLELARTLARKFNKRFGQTFMEPQSILTKTPRVMSLDNPEKKMSKSLPNSCLFLDDSPLEIEQKIKRAVTDSGSEIKYDQQNKAGVANLLEIYSELSGKTIPSIEKMYVGKGYGQFKADLAKIVADALKPFREKQISGIKCQEILKAGAKKACDIACNKMEEVKKKIGLLQ